MVGLAGVAKTYGTFTALDATDLDVRAGEFLTLLGPSGSGKTTLLNIIAGMVSPSRGSVAIDGRDVTRVPAERRGIGMVFQNYALMPHMTVFENIAFPLRIRKVPKAEITRRVREVLDLVRLPRVADRMPKALSGGQQQRVSIARCIVYRPSLILMDEPLGALDKKLREQMQIEINRLHRELGITMIYVTHDQEEALNMSNRILLMNAGRIEQLGTPRALYFEPASQFAADFIGASTLLDAEVEQAGPALRARLRGGVTCGAVTAHNVRPGDSGKILLRPEALRIVDPARIAPGENALEGTFETTLVTGAAVKHFIKLDTGEGLAVQELNGPSAERFGPSQRVGVTWATESCRFLAR